VPKAYPQAAVYWFGKNIADATPRVCRAPKHEVPDCYTGRYCHPVACEGDPTRLEKEIALMGGDKPVWELEVISGNLRWHYVNDWKAKVTGRGKGRLRWWFENRDARSKWLQIER
jgi:hypothetical protein